MQRGFEHGFARRRDNTHKPRCVTNRRVRTEGWVEAACRSLSAKQDPFSIAVGSNQLKRQVVVGFSSLGLYGPRQSAHSGCRGPYRYICIGSPATMRPNQDSGLLSGVSHFTERRGRFPMQGHEKVNRRQNSETFISALLHLPYRKHGGDTS